METNYSWKRNGKETYMHKIKSVINILYLAGVKTNRLRYVNLKDQMV